MTDDDSGGLTPLEGTESPSQAVQVHMHRPAPNPVTGAQPNREGPELKDRGLRGQATRHARLSGARGSRERDPTLASCRPRSPNWTVRRASRAQFWVPRY